MIECEKCGKYFHADEIHKCPECVMELCEICSGSHVINCITNYVESDLD